MSALGNLPKKMWKGCTLLVIRYDWKRKKFLTSKPCADCAAKLTRANIKVFYLDLKD